MKDRRHLISEERIGTMLKAFIAGASFCAITMAQGSNQTQAVDHWKAVRFLLGTWEAKTRGGSAGAAALGTYTFRLELKDHVLARHSASAGCSGPADFNCEHVDLLYIYQSAGAQPLEAIYFDNEGHVIHYEVTTPAPNTTVLVSPALSNRPQYRLIYQLRGPLLLGKFQLRMPGESEFHSYLEWSGGRK
jgi:hypothetical protein